MINPGGTAERAAPALRREIGLIGAVTVGLGSIIGTGIYVGFAIAAGVTGPAVVLATAVAAAIAACNGLSSAQLAAHHPLSGGTYEFGYQRGAPLLGFLAGWMFLCAKSASAATAALGFGAYLLQAAHVEASAIVPAVGCVAVMTLLVACGIRRSNQANIAIVALTLLSLATFVLCGAGAAWRGSGENLQPFFLVQDGGGRPAAFLQACALMFVAFTGYGRIATMGEEVHDPRRTIPRAIGWSLAVAALVYIAVGLVAVAAVGTESLASAAGGKAAPLRAVADETGAQWVGGGITAGAITAMLGVLLNLILGLSRMVLAMGRRGDMPRALARVGATTASPTAAVVVVGVAVAALALTGSVRTTWSFSAFTVLVYYAITNWLALGMREEERLYPRWVAAVGLVACLSLTFFVEPRIWLTGIALLGIGLIWYRFRIQKS